MTRLPKTSDFPSKFKLDIIPPPNNDAPSNILILLHGLGDTHLSFSTLARSLALPETVCLSLSGPAPLLDLGGFHWGNDILFSSSTGALDYDAGFTSSTACLTQLFELLTKTEGNGLGFSPRQIHLLGYGQGGSAALHFALSLSTSTELGGIVSIGGPLGSDAPSALVTKCKTPVLVCGGDGESSLVTAEAETKLKRSFEHVEVKRYRRPGDGMPSNRDEMTPIMAFLARRLRSMKGVPEGAVEIGA